MRNERVDVDILAGNLKKWRDVALAMPPSWEDAGVSPMIVSPHGERIGSILPGKGIYINSDLKRSGITRRIPGVYERSVVRRGAERLARARDAIKLLWQDEAAAITSYDGIINARGNGNGQNLMVLKTSFTTVANAWFGTWQAGGNPSAGSYTATPGSAPDNTTAGALSQAISDPSGSNTQYLLTFGFTSSVALNVAFLGDLLSQVGALSATSTASQTVSSTTITRNYTTGGLGSGVQMTFDVTTALGGTASNIVVTYTNQAGTAGRVTTAAAMIASGIAQRLTPAVQAPSMFLQSGDSGVRQVNSIQLSASMTAGVFALNLWYPLAFLPGIVANVYVERDSTVQIDGLLPLIVGSGTNIGALTLYVQANTTTSGLILGTMRTCQG
jgi:hypothetical protein